MRSMFVAAWFLAASVCGCGGSNPGPSLTITPEGTSGMVQITGPTDFSAVLANVTPDVTAKVTWTATGGTLSNDAGLHTVYTPPPGTSMGMLTATAGGLSASVQISSAPAVTNKTIPGLTAPVTVQYDAQDIPHIQCAAAVDCVAVQGYVQARDRWFPMDFIRHVARAKLAEMIGVDGLSQDVQLRTLFVTRDGKRLENELANALDAQTRTLLTAFAAGVNAYLAELRAGAPLPGEYAQLPFRLTGADIADWTIQDTLAVGRLNQFQLSESLTAESANGQFAAVYSQGPLQDLGKLNAWIRAAPPTTERGHTLSAGPAPAAAVPASGRGPTFDMSKWRNVLGKLVARASSMRDALRPADASVGSNNWVVAGAKSATQRSMVANDPHLSLQYPPLFHLSAMTSSKASDNLDVTGGSFPGVPGALVGRGAHVGWGVTVVGYDVTDVYLEQFLPQAGCPGGASGPPCVLFNSAPASTLPVPQTYCIRVPAGAGTPSQACPAGTVDSRSLSAQLLPNPPPPVVLIVPHHGPIIQAPDAAGKAVSVRWTGHEGNTQDSKAFYGLNTATNVDTAMTALKDFATGAQNFVLADDQGHIAYYPHALVPVRKFAVKGTATPPWFPLPGDGSAEWGDGVANCAAAGPTALPAACWIADSALPQGKDPAKGYYFTANADPLGVSDDNDPLPDPAITPAEPPYMSFDWDDSSGFRATRIEQLMNAAITAHGNITLADMEAIQSDHVSRPGMAFAPLIAALPGTPADLAAAKAILAQWATNGFDCPSGLTGSDPRASPSATDAKVLQNSAGCFLFHAFLRTLITRVFTDDLAVVGQRVNALAALKALLFLIPLPDGAPGTSFCNDVDSKGQLVTAHTCGSQLATALIVAYDTMVAQLGADPNRWLWGRVHTMQPVSLLALVTNGYEPGPFARPGGAFTVDVGSPSLTGGGLSFPYGSSGNVRHISVMDPTAPKVRMQLPGPERDVPAVLPGPNLLGLWVSNTYFDYAVGAQANSVAVSTLSFKAP